jgi:hypothetical protein
MANRYGSRPRPPGTHITSSNQLRSTTARLTPDVRDKLDRVSERLGISVSATVSELIERLAVDENFDPGWRSRYARPEVTERQPPLDMTA